MRVSRRSPVAVFALVGALAGLTGCTTSEPEAQPQPTASATPTPEPEESTLPGSRVPVECREWLTGISEFAVSTVDPRPLTDLGLLSSIGQSGFEVCRAEGAIGSTPAVLTFVIGVDIDPAGTSNAATRLAENGFPTDIGGEISWSECRAIDNPASCVSEVFVDGYLAQFVVALQGPIADDFDQAFVSFTATLGERMAAWGPPSAPWQLPDDALVWSHDCEGEVAATDEPIRAALGFEAFGATGTGSGDGLGLFFIAQKRQDLTTCEWMGVEPGDNASIEIAPGAEWLLDAGEALPGDPISYPGARAAAVERFEGSSSIWVRVIVDGSLVAVGYQLAGSDADDEAETAGALRVIDAIVATFGSR